MNTTQEILAQFDRCAEEFTFPMLDNGYIYAGDARLTVYRNTSDWLIILEALGASSPRVSGYDSFQNCLHLFGSALHREPGTANEDFLYPVKGCQDAPLFEDEYEWFARDDTRCLMIRDQRIVLDLTPEHLRTKGITLLEPPRKDPPAILRSLLPEHRDQLFASDERLAARNPHDLPLWMRLDEWHHPDLVNGELPSASEAFQMLAEAIASGNKTTYSPTQPPNLHWKHWLDGGTL